MFREPISFVTVSINYADFLDNTLKYNRLHADKYVVVTAPDDIDTRNVCRKYEVTCLVTEDHKRDGDFSKGRLIERGLQHLPAEGWVVHIDADTVLPPSFRQDIEFAHLDNTCIYGADRILVNGYNDWQKFLATGWMTNNHFGNPHAVIAPKGYRIGTRWCGPDGYCPIGFFSMHHRNGGEEEWCGIRAKPYPRNHGNACRSDVQMSLQWDRRKRVLLPEFYVVHLDSEESEMGKNWNGRKSKYFGPTEEANKKKVGFGPGPPHKHHHHHHHHYPYPDPYNHHHGHNNHNHQGRG